MSETPKLTKAQRDARYRKLPVALIQRPLRLIASRTAERIEKDGVITFAESPVAKAARYAAASGQGHFVRSLARSYC